MSYTDEQGNHRDATGGFYANQHTHSLEEQRRAGVNQYDTSLTAHLAVQSDRRSRGLDPLTGLDPKDSMQLASTPSSYAASGPSPLAGPVVLGLLLPLGIALVGWGLWVGAVSANEVWLKSETKTRIVHAVVASALGAPKIVPPEMIMKESPALKTMEARELAKEIQRVHPTPSSQAETAQIVGGRARWVKAPQPLAKTETPLLNASSYRCVADPACWASFQSEDWRVQALTVAHATTYLIARAKEGDKLAEEQACLLAPMRLERAMERPNPAFNICSHVAEALPGSAIVKEQAKVLAADSSWRGMLVRALTFRISTLQSDIEWR